LRIMALDLGDSRTGVAVSDISEILCGEAFVIHEKKRKELIEKIVSQCQEKEVSRVVIGNPLNMDGSKSPRSETSERLAHTLERRGLEAVLWDERRTSVSAAEILHSSGRHGRKNRDNVDAVAASLILEGYLAKLNYEKREK